jgi:hypothetical protein
MIMVGAGVKGFYHVLLHRRVTSTTMISYPGDEFDMCTYRSLLAAYSRSGDNYWRKKEIGEEEGFNWSSTSVFPYPLQTAWVSFNIPFPYTVHSGPEYRVFGLLALRPTRRRGETGSVLVAVSRPNNGALLTISSGVSSIHVPRTSR